MTFFHRHLDEDPEEHNSARGKMPRREQVSYEQFEGGVQHTSTDELFGMRDPMIVNVQ